MKPASTFPPAGEIFGIGPTANPLLGTSKGACDYSRFRLTIDGLSSSCTGQHRHRTDRAPGETCKTMRAVRCDPPFHRTGCPTPVDVRVQRSKRPYQSHFDLCGKFCVDLPLSTGLKEFGFISLTLPSDINASVGGRAEPTSTIPKEYGGRDFCAALCLLMLRPGSAALTLPDRVSGGQTGREVVRRRVSPTPT